ncbi:MAG: methyltransferase domain-containing protein [Candidatus Aureabacteria bacterium]|nr:methyltransferase domain-containing protein [Candidatus Auribacterota bacterium]
MTQKAIFDDEAKKWQSLYLDSSSERWGIFQGYVRKRTRARMDLCLSLLPPLKGKEIIELGCGPGYYGIRLIRGGAIWTGVDISRAMLTVCRENTRSNRLVLANVLALPFRPGSCDILLCIGVLSYLRKSEIAALFSRVSDILRKGGIFLVQTVRLDPLTWIRCRLPCRIPRPFRIPGPLYPRNPKTIAQLLQTNGFSIRRIIPYRKFIIYPAGTVYVAVKE